MMSDFFLLAQFFMHRSGSLTTITHGEDYGSTATHDIATMKTTKKLFITFPFIFSSLFSLYSSPFTLCSSSTSPRM